MRTNSSGLILLESIFRLILEGRKEDAISKNPNLTNEIEILSFNDPTGNLKFLPWQIKMLKSGVSINSIQRFSSLFFKFANRLAKDGKSSDINFFQANMFDDTLQSLETYESETKEKEKQLKDAKAGSEIVFESDYFIMRAIKNKAAANSLWT